MSERPSETLPEETGRINYESLGPETPRAREAWNEALTTPIVIDSRPEPEGYKRFANREDSYWWRGG